MFCQYTLYEPRTENDHGDVCRRSYNAWKCPPGCTRRGGPPYCSKSGNNMVTCRSTIAQKVLNAALNLDDVEISFKSFNIFGLSSSDKFCGFILFLTNAILQPASQDACINKLPRGLSIVL